MADNPQCIGIDCAWCLNPNCPNEKENVMTDKQIIIDGVDVSECSWYKQGATGMICADWSLSNDCSKNLNCYYKQLKRKEQECEALKLSENEAIEIIAELKEELKIVTAQSRHAEQALDKIEKAIKEINEIINIINKAKEQE